jgi:thioredoxin-like negative regulator of GroEL
MLHVSLLSTGMNSYAEAHKVHSETGQPMVILVGAEWCPACVQMKNSAIPQVARRGLLKKVAFATVNTDQQGSLARKLMKGGSIPQLIMYRKTRSGWSRRLLVGKQSPEQIEAFINQGLEAQQAESQLAEPAAASTVKQASQRDANDSSIN